MGIAAVRHLVRHEPDELLGVRGGGQALLCPGGDQAAVAQRQPVEVHHRRGQPLRVVQTANTGRQLAAGGNSSWCPELESLDHACMHKSDPHKAALSQSPTVR